MNVAGRFCAATVRGIMATSNVREHVEDSNWNPSTAERSKNFLVALWHENLLLGGWAIGRVPHIRTLASSSHDGEIAAGVASGFGFTVLRGSSSQGGVRALRQIVQFGRTLAIFRMLLTPDGPRGPRRTMKDGAAYVASRCQLPIICLGVACDDSWRLKSWDQLQIPKPFKTVQFYFTAPIRAVPALGRDGLTEFTKHVESEMSRAQKLAESMLGPRSDRGAGSQPSME